MAIHPVKRLSISEQVFLQLKDQLIKGLWKPGDKLPSENELAAAMGVSRVTVRNAIQKLTALGLVETRFGEGSFVREITPGHSMNSMIPMAYLGENSLQEVLEFRKVIEGSMAELACEKADAGDIAALSGIFERMNREKHNKAEFSRADFDFHRELVRITRNSLIIETYRILEDLLKAAMEQIVDYRGNTQGLYYHGRLLEAMREGRPAECRQLMTEHVNETYDSVMEYLDIRA